jgi:xanthine dehydrogenase C subunit
LTLSNEFVSVMPSVWEPDSLNAAWELYEKFGLGSRFVAGGTWLRTQWESGNTLMPDHLISLAAISEMSGVRAGENSISIGAGTTLNELRRNLLVQKEFPHLVEAIRCIAAPSIRNMATIGGNILSFVGDSLPALLVIGAELNWFDGVKHSSELLQDWLSTKTKAGFHTEKRILVSIQLPLMQGRNLTYYHKVGRREAFTPSLLTVAYQGCVNAAGRLSDFRIAAGGGGAIGMRLTLAEGLLNGNPYSAALLHKLQTLIREQMMTYSDAFASAPYRQNTAANLISAALWKSLEASI